MLAKFERRVFEKGCYVWLGKYRGLHNVPHWHYENELAACSEGSAIVMLDGQQYTLKSGMCILIRSESIHSITGSPESRIVVAQFDQSLCSYTFPNWPARQLFDDLFDAYTRMDYMYREQKEKKLFYCEKINAAMSQLIIDIFRNEPLMYIETSESRTMTRYRELLNAIEHSYNNISFTEAAAFMNMSEAYFSRFFKRNSGMTFSRYLNVVRIGKAIEILHENSGITIAALMAECGFNTIRNFNRVFKEITGYSPTCLPHGFILDYRSLATCEESFDPTMEESILLD